MNFLTQLWNTVKSNPVFVAFYSAFIGAIGSAVSDQFTKGHIDLTKAGITQMVSTAAGVAVVAVVHLYQKPPVKES